MSVFILKFFKTVENNVTYVMIVSGKIVKVNIPSTVKSIRARAFMESEIREITIPETVTQLSGSAFYSCSNLERVVIKAPITKIEMNIFAKCFNLKSVVLPNTIREIDSYAFQYCRSLISINIPSSLKVLNRAVFEDCSSLVSIDLKNCENIGSHTFSFCKSLRNVKMEKCKDIGAIFRECTSLKEIRISENVQYIAGEAFRECSSLEKVYVCNPDTRIEINSFEATVKPDNAIIKKVTWTSSNSKIASVSLSGKITAKHPGTASNMKGAKYAAVKNSAIRSYTRKDVKSGATYYVRVRTFNIVNGKRIYSDWSGIKRMRVK